jgi:hypothetical protein
MLERYVQARLLAERRAVVSRNSAHLEREQAAGDVDHRWLHDRAAVIHEQCAAAHDRLARLLSTRIEEIVLGRHRGGSFSPTMARSADCLTEEPRIVDTD